MGVHRCDDPCLRKQWFSEQGQQSVHRRTHSERVDEVRQRLENNLVAPPAVGLSEQQIARRPSMSRFHRLGCGVALSAFAIAISTRSAVAQNQPNSPANPYRLIEGWPTLPKTMNGSKWGEVIRVHVATDGTIWVFHRCFNTVPPGHATCINRGESNPPILQFDRSGKLLKTSRVGMFAYPHTLPM